MPASKWTTKEMEGKMDFAVRKDFQLTNKLRKWLIHKPKKESEGKNNIKITKRECYANT